MTAPLGPRSPTTADDSAVENILGELRWEIAALFGDEFSPEAIRADVDVLEGGEPLVVGRPLDSMDLIHVIAAVEDHFDLSLAQILTSDVPLTLHNVARYIAQAMP